MTGKNRKSFLIVLLASILTGLTQFGCKNPADVEPLEIEIISPQKDIPYCATVPIELRVNDTRNVDAVEISLDGQVVHVFTREPFITQLDISDFEEKSVLLRVTAHKREGNRAEAEVHINHFHGLKITSPNSGEGWMERSTQSIAWERSGPVANFVSLYYSFNRGVSWTQILASTANSGSYPWTLPDVSETAASCRVKVACLDDSHFDMSDDDFTITRWSSVLAGFCSTPGFPLGVFVSENYAYVTDGYGGLRTIDVSDPASPILVGSYITPSDRTWAVVVLGAYAYVADGHAGLHVFDISAPSGPKLISSHDTPDQASGLFLSEGYAYVADRYSGLRIIDVFDPTSPTLAGSFDTPGSAYGVSVSGPYAYVADGDSGLQIITVADPTSPTRVAVHDTPGTAYGVFKSGTYVYVADGNAGLQIINVADPTSPTLAGSIAPPGNARGVFISGTHAYMATMLAGLQIINVSNPASPILVESIDTSVKNAMSVFVSGNYAYVTEHAKRLLIYDVSGYQL